MENNQKYIKVKCSSEHDYEAIFNYCKKNFPNIKVKAKPKKLVIRVPLSTNGDRAAEEMDLFVDAINTFVCPEDKVKYKLKTYTEDKTHNANSEKTSVTMAHFSGGTGTPEDNVGYSFHDTVADEIFKGALLRGESPLVALHELEKRTNLMAIRAAFDGADEFTTDMSDYEREEDYGL